MVRLLNKWMVILFDEKKQKKNCFVNLKDVFLISVRSGANTRGDVPLFQKNYMPAIVNLAMLLLFMQKQIY